MREYHTKKKDSYYKEVIRLRYESGYSVRRISEVFPVSKNTVSRWIRIFETGNQKSAYVMKSKTTGRPVNGAGVQETPEELRRRIRELEKQLEDAEFRATAYKRMIEVTESMGMPVRKKAGAKR